MCSIIASVLLTGVSVHLPIHLISTFAHILVSLTTRVILVFLFWLAALPCWNRTVLFLLSTTRNRRRNGLTSVADMLL